MTFSLVLFDLDGTLLDSDAALMAPYVALGVRPEDVTFGHVVADECARLGLAMDDYLDRYDTEAASPYPGAPELVAGLGRWAICSNKVRRAGVAELTRLGWRPELAWFAEDFGGAAKHLGPVLQALGSPPLDEVVFVGDTPHDRRCAADAGVAFALAAWNPRATSEPGDLVLQHPSDLIESL